jgi:hypothetical protein
MARKLRLVVTDLEGADRVAASDVAAQTPAERFRAVGALRQAYYALHERQPQRRLARVLVVDDLEALE